MGTSKKLFSELTIDEKMEVNLALGKAMWDMNMAAMEEAKRNKKPCSKNHNPDDWDCMWMDDYEIHGYKHYPVPEEVLKSYQ